MNAVVYMAGDMDFTKERIVITRCSDEAEIFDRPLSLPSHFNKEFWLQVLLSHCGGLIHKCAVNINFEHLLVVRPLRQPCRWYPRCFFKTLLLVSAILAYIFWMFKHWVAVGHDRDICAWVPDRSRKWKIPIPQSRGIIPIRIHNFYRIFFIFFIFFKFFLYLFTFKFLVIFQYAFGYIFKA